MTEYNEIGMGKRTRQSQANGFLSLDSDNTRRTLRQFSAEARLTVSCPDRKSVTVSFFQLIFGEFPETDLAAPRRVDDLVTIGACLYLPARVVAWGPPLLHPVRELFVGTGFLQALQFPLVLLVEPFGRVH